MGCSGQSCSAVTSKTTAESSSNTWRVTFCFMPPQEFTNSAVTVIYILHAGVRNMKGKQVLDDVTEAFLKSSVAVPKLFYFGSGSGSPFVLILAWNELHTSCQPQIWLWYRQYLMKRIILAPALDPQNNFGSTDFGSATLLKRQKNIIQ